MSIIFSVIIIILFMLYIIILFYSMNKDITISRNLISTLIKSHDLIVEQNDLIKQECDILRKQNKVFIDICDNMSKNIAITNNNKE